MPLQPLTSENGPTEFRPASHRRGGAKRVKRAEVAVECAAGDAILFDYRVDHRGLANGSDADRLVFFVGLGRPSFRDTRNTRSGVPLFPETHERWAPRLVAEDGAVTPLEGDDSGEKFVLFQMTVDLGEGRSGALRVHAGDEAAAVAAAFCAAHALPAMCAEPLAASIAQQMELARGAVT